MVDDKRITDGILEVLTVLKKYKDSEKLIIFQTASEMIRAEHQTKQYFSSMAIIAQNLMNNSKDN